MNFGERTENDVQKEDYDKFVHSFKDKYPGICKDRSIWTIDCRRFDDPNDNDRSTRKHEDYEIHSGIRELPRGT